MTGPIVGAIVGAIVVLVPLKLHGQSVEAKLAALEKLAPAERQQRVLEGARSRRSGGLRQPYFLSPSLVFMSANAPHPFAGALFTDYLLSEEGQKIIVTTNRMSAHARVKSPESQLLEGHEVRMPDIFDIGRRYRAIGNRYREVFPGAR